MQSSTEPNERSMMQVDALPLLHRNPTLGPSRTHQASQAIFVPHYDRPNPNTVEQATNTAKIQFIINGNLNADLGFINGPTDILQSRGVIDQSTDYMNTGFDQTMYNDLGRDFRAVPAHYETTANRDPDRQGGFMRVIWLASRYHPF
jgi:hypothetical protein